MCVLKTKETSSNRMVPCLLTRMRFKPALASLTCSVTLRQQPVAIGGWQWGFIVNDQILPCQISERTRLQNYHIYTPTWALFWLHSKRTLEHLFEKSVICAALTWSCVNVFAVGPRGIIASYATRPFRRNLLVCGIFWTQKLFYKIQKFCRRSWKDWFVFWSTYHVVTSD